MSGPLFSCLNCVFSQKSEKRGSRGKSQTKLGKVDASVFLLLVLSQCLKAGPTEKGAKKHELYI